MKIVVADSIYLPLEYKEKLNALGELQVFEDMPSSGRGMVISAWLTGIYFAIEMGIGLWTGSIAVISDALHTFSAVGACWLRSSPLSLLAARQTRIVVSAGTGPRLSVHW